MLRIERDGRRLLVAYILTQYGKGYDDDEVSLISMFITTKTRQQF